jgi:2-polyprenyl-6-methoxyphenol hydroxylase-like FAD-dependent oxidoreductase
MATPVRDVLVVGGGIGGLAAATALAQRGFEVRVVERRAHFRSKGVGLGQPANALRALRAIGVLGDVLAAGFEYENFKIYDLDRRLIVDHRFRMGGDGVPAVVALPRKDLHCILLDAAEAAGCKVDLGVEPVALESGADAVQVELGDGSSHQADLLVGFDGVSSWTRRQLYGDRHTPTDSGTAAWRLIVPRPSDVTCMEFYQGLGHKTGVMPLNEHEMYLFHIRPEERGLRPDPDRLHELLAERLESYGGVAADVRDELSPESQITYSRLEPLFLEEPWHSGRAVVGGDAAHTYPPHMTQGAAMALEDGLALSDELRAGAPLEQGLSAYGARRRERCRYVYEFANKMLRDEQAIRTREQLEAARATGFGDMDSRLSAGDRIMDEYELGISSSAGRS